eukprot:6527852-Lingulodinium_polyedra.AAC.1
MLGHRHAPCWSECCSAEAARVAEHWTGRCQACPGVSCPAAGVVPALQLAHSGHAPGRVGSRLVPALLAHAVLVRALEPGAALRAC